MTSAYPFPAAGAGLLFLAILAGCSGIQKKETDMAIDVGLLDSAYKPTDDFFAFVNQKWIDSHPIPASKSSWGAFYELREQSSTALRGILEESAEQEYPASDPRSIIGDFWIAAMDSARISDLGWAPLMPDLKAWKHESDPTKRSTLLAMQLKRGAKGPFDVYVYQDLKDATRQVLYVNQGGLGLPDRDYYFRTGERADEIRAEYQSYIGKLLESIGLYDASNAKRLSAAVYGIEFRLAKASMTLEQQRDPYASYHLLSLEKVQKTYPELDWETLFLQMGMAPTELILGQPDFFRQLNQEYRVNSAEIWTAYQQFHLANSFATEMHPEAEELHFAFYGTFLNGKKEMEPRWKRMAESADTYLRDLLGKEYVKKHFDESGKARALELVENLKSALAVRIQKLDWMGDSTKVAALDKLEKVMVKVGYPDQWRSYEGLKFSKTGFLENVRAAESYEFSRMAKKLGKPVDRAEWFMGPQTVNAYYNPTLNEIVFPAAILQPPFFYREGDDAVNYGGIGMVIGHELTHGFDDQGRLFDGDGNLRSWWTAQDEAGFKEKTKAFVELYNSYAPLSNVNINGTLTLGENIADLGGMVIAWEAFKIASAKNPQRSVSGLSPEQRFFLNFGQIWRGHDTPKSLEQKLYTDVHSPAKYRVTGVLSNFEPFYEVFQVKKGDGLFIEQGKRCSMW